MSSSEYGREMDVRREVNGGIGILLDREFGNSQYLVDVFSETGLFLANSFNIE